MTTAPPQEELAFNELCSHLDDIQHQVLEIEILSSASCPPGPPSVLRDGNCVGVPKALLIPAFKHALNILALGSRQSGTAVDRQRNHKDESLRLKATLPILLLAPEHLTAANIRKRHLQQLQHLASTSVPTPQAPHISKDLAHALTHELNLLDSLLTSPLHRHAKSPTLWSHRRWLLTAFPAIPAILSGRGELGGEYDIVHRAAVRHARNYVAFDYLRRRMRDARMGMGSSGKSEREREREGVGAEAAIPLATLTAHALGNPSDISRLSFLQHVLDLHSLPPAEHCNDDKAAAAAGTVQHILNTALQFRLRGEAMWTFLRWALVCREGGGAGRWERGRMLGQLGEWLGRHEGEVGGERGDGGGDVDVDGDVDARELFELREVMGASLRWIAARGGDVGVG